MSNIFNIFRNLSLEDKKIKVAIKNIIGCYPDNIFLYKMAFRHKSVANEISNGIKDSNERLEYLGDAILGAVVADFLFNKFPFKDEGFLTQMRSKIVSRDNLGKLSEKLGINKLIVASKDSTLNSNYLGGNAFEAFIGALYIDKGYNRTKKLIINRIIKYHIDIDELESKEHNFKSRIIEWSQKEKKNVEFALDEEACNGNTKLFYVKVLIDNEIKGKGVNFSKKKAEQIAAEEALKSVTSDQN